MGIFIVCGLGYLYFLFFKIIFGKLGFLLILIKRL